MVTGPGRGRHLEQPDWVAGTQEVSSTETPHPAGDDLRILRQRSSPSHGRDHGTGRGRAPQSTSLPARTRARRSVETTVPREHAFVGRARFHPPGNDAGLSCLTSGVGTQLHGTSAVCPAPSVPYEQVRTSRRGHRMRRNEPRRTQSCVEMLGRERVWCAGSSHSVDAADGFCLASARH
jgi:hypothetical protein